MMAVMAQKQKNLQQSVRHTVLRITRVHYLYIAAYMFSIIIFDSWNLIEHEAVLQRWTAAGALLIVNTIIWYICRAKLKNENIYKGLLMVLLVSDILFAAVNVYWQRGMASKSVMLFVVPVLSAGLVKSRSLLLAATTIAATAYSIASVRYFYENYGQGFRIELYGEVFFYSALLFVIAGFMMIGFRKAPD